jgi:RNA polymerase sigma factor (sigma-70 family)
MSNHNNNKNLLDQPTPEAFFSDCYNQHRHAIYTFLLDHTEDAALCLDLTQNVFLKFWTLRDQYQQIGNVRGYLTQMARNAFLDTCRQDKNRLTYAQSLSDDADTSRNLTESMFDERELQRTFQQAILELSKQRRIVYVLSQIEGWRREQIADTLGISPFTVKVTLQKAVLEVRKKCAPARQFTIKQNK